MWTTQLLYGHEARLLSVTRMRPDVFNKLLNWLQEYGGLKDTKLLSAAEKLVIFLMIFSKLCPGAPLFGFSETSPKR